MMQIGLIGLGAGAASALLFASVASGSLLSIFLFYLAPLPIMIAAIGWSHWAAAIAALLAAAALAAVLGTTFFFAYLVGSGAPAWWLGYLAMLARPVGNGGGSLEWYPPGRLVLWSAALATLVVVVAVFNLGTDLDSFRAGLRAAIDKLIVIGDGKTTTPQASPNVARLVDFLVAAIPPGAAVLATITNVLNLWLAARIVKFSALLRRPWPDLSAVTFPPTASIALAIAIALSFLSGLVGLIATALMAALLTAYGVLGFAVLHTLTRGMSARPFVLGGVYAVVVVFGWPLIALCLLGMLEAALGLRARFGHRGGPPAPT
ncbi:MAG: hypothetical protein AB7O50_14910 [Pseudolabrys sp.]